MERFDVAVIGAGIAGLHCAAELARRALRVALLDRQARPGDRVATTGIFVRKTLEDFDVPEHCFGPWVSDVVLHSPRGRELALGASHPEFRIARMRALYDHLLARCIARGVRWLPATAFQGCTEGDRGSVVRIAPSTEIFARFIIGADGARSRVARALSLDVNRQWIVGVEDVFATGPFSSVPRLHCWLDPAIAPGYIAWVTEDGVETHVGVGGYADRFAIGSALRTFHNRIGERFGFEPDRWLEKRAGCIPVGGTLRNIANRRGALVGDAAGGPSPLTGGGIDACFRLSAAVARAAGEFLQTGSAAGLDALCDGRIRARFFSRRFLRRALGAIHEPWQMEAAFAALASPLLRPFVRVVFFARGSFPDIGRPVGSMDAAVYGRARP